MIALTWIGRFTLLCAESLAALARGRLHLRNTLQAAATIGADSWLVVAVIAFIAGSVLSLQMADKFRQTGAEAYVGGLVALAIVREIAPIFTSLAVGARAGTAIAAELAHMTISDQLSALSVLGVRPVRFLMLPRLVAAALVMPLLSVMAAVIGIVGGMVAALQVARIHSSKFLESVWLTLTPRDVEISLLKAVLFGLIMAGIACTVGLYTRGGAKEVGQATTRSAVWTAVVIILLDFVLTWFFF
jgi:phospholipid/cholesterol/gamma-HCH transport system permease protein